MLLEDKGRELCQAGEPPPGCVAVCVQGDAAALLLEAAPEGETCRTGWPSLHSPLNHGQEERTFLNP